MTQKERIAAGLLYTDTQEAMPEECTRARELSFEFNHTAPSQKEKRESIIRSLFGKIGNKFTVEGPIYVSYGSNVFVGDDFYANFNLSLVDDYTITIGSRVLIAPNVVISTSGHPIHPELRAQTLQFSFPVVIEDDVWIGSGVIINPGVTIGRGTVIGAGSVVTKDIPAGVVAMGTPCKVAREINARDKEYYYKDFRVGK